jgi:large subunit ribosomal protein L25
MTTRETVVLETQIRTARGRKAGALRRQSITPIHVYGKDVEPLSLQVDTQTLQRTLARVGHSVPLTVRVGSDEHFVFAREVQRHPVTDLLIHVDFLQVSLTERITSDVPIELEGEAPGARAEGAIVSHDHHTLFLEALPMDLPPVITVDVSVLAEVGAAIHASDIRLGANVTLITDPETVIARIVILRPVAESGAVAEMGEEGSVAEVGAAEEASEAGEESTEGESSEESAE